MRQTLLATVLVGTCVAPPPPVAPERPSAPSRAKDPEATGSDVRWDVIDPQSPRDWCEDQGQDYGDWDGAVIDSAAREP